MAEGRSNLAESHEEIFDYNCSQCEIEDKFVEAVAYCPECPSYFCGSCLEIHSRFLVTKSHAVLDETRKEDWGTAKRGRKSGRECSKHNGEIIATFCGSHDALCCPLCASLDHRTCQDMKPIAEVAKGVTKSAEFLQIKTKVDQILVNLKKAKTTKERDQADINASREQVLNDIALFKRQVIATIDKLAEKVKTDMENAFTPIVDDLMSCLVTCEKLDAAFKSFQGTYDTNQNITDTDMFIKMKLCKGKISEYETVSKMIAQPVKPRMYFVENAPLLQDIENAACFGEIECDSFYTNKPYRVSSQGVSKPNVRIPSDTSTCYIDGICQMPNGQVIVADAFNKNVKRLDSTYKVADHCDVSDRPNAICKTGEREIVVAMESNGLQFIEIGEKMTKTKSIALGHESFGIAYHDDKLYVSDKNQKVYVHDMLGGLSSTIQYDSSGSDLFSATRHLTVSANGARLYVADREMGLVVLDREGKHMHTVTSPELKGARGVCLDHHGNVFLLCCLSNNIAQIDFIGEAIVGIFVERKHGVFAPGAVVFDKNRSSLVVTSSPRSGGDILDVCHLENN